LEIAIKRGDNKNKTCAYLALGDAYRLDRQVETGMEYYEKALEIPIHLYKQEETRTYLELGHAYTC
jgi:tetratricopeptide (TPR) repeat protein